MKSKIRRINFYGGACSGKSTLATYVFSILKQEGYSIEYVSEFIKQWTYIPIIPKSYDSVFCSINQIHNEDIVLRGETELIVSDSPIFLQYFYNNYHNSPGQEGFLKIALEYETIYPSLNILLTRNDIFYRELGRYEKIDEAKLIDIKIEEMLLDLNIIYKKFNCEKINDIVCYIKTILKAENMPIY
jgi:nicotinamide riboside kinase